MHMKKIILPLEHIPAAELLYFINSQKNVRIILELFGNIV